MTSSDLARAEDRVVDALRAQYGKKASPAELEVFAAAARHLQLSIPAGEIALVPYGNVNQIQITLEGRRTIAQRTGRLRGIQGPEWCGPRRYDKDGNKLPLEWEEVWTGDGTPYAARVFVTVDGWDRPANGTCKWSEFNQPNSPVWKKYQSHMLGNAAEKLALRRGFSAEIGKALADLADITGDYQTVNDETGEIEESPAAPAATVAAAIPQTPGDPSPGRRPAATRQPPKSAPHSGRRPPARDQPPADYYDNLPESRNYDESQPASYEDPDPGRPFT